MRKIFLFKEVLYLTKIDREVKGNANAITMQNQVTETKIKMFDLFRNNASESARKFHHAGSASNGK